MPWAGRPQAFVRPVVPGSAAIGSGPALNQTAGMDAPSAPTVARPVMLHEWSTVTFLHWPYRPPVVQRLLPRGLVYSHAEHPPWPLARARAVDVAEDLIEAAGLPAPQGRPLVHHSAGVRVRIGAWKPVRT